MAGRPRRSPRGSYAFDFARVFAPLFAAALRFEALRLRVAAAFFAAALRFAGPPVARSSMSRASERRSVVAFFTLLGVRFCVLAAASEIDLATRLRRPRAR